MIYLRLLFIGDLVVVKTSSQVCVVSIGAVFDDSGCRSVCGLRLALVLMSEVRIILPDSGRTSSAASNVVFILRESRNCLDVRNVLGIWSFSAPKVKDIKNRAAHTTWRRVGSMLCLMNDPTRRRSKVEGHKWTLFFKGRG